MRVVRNIIPMTVAIIFLLPILWMLVVSIKYEGMKVTNVLDWFAPPYTFDNYAKALTETPILRWMANSFIVATVSTFLTVLFTSLAAFALSRMNFRYKNLFYIFFLAGLMVSPETTIIPLYQVVKGLHMLDSYAGLIIPTVAAPIGVIILKSFFDSIPRELIESAQMDGCGWFRIYAQIVMPLSKPALVAVAILTFIASWNNFLWPFLSTTTESLFTLPMGIPTLLKAYSEDYVTPMTVNSISSIPVIIVFLLFEKQIVKGISFTGIK
ncbi:MAG TPA: carbohydrate ABC transporter permease [Candidatus Bathyarchaeia archaeon]|nr:carbohydrate ABC transporter permease [Candidatus Bathyarchaeia archaeon]